MQFKSVIVLLVVISMIVSAGAVPTMIPTTEPTINPAASDSFLCSIPGISLLISECPESSGGQGPAGPPGEGNTTVLNFWNLTTGGGNFSTVSNVTNFFNVYYSEMNQTANQTPGPKGDTGDPGAPGQANMTAGPPGLNNMTAGPEGPMNQTPGYTPIKGVDYFDGLNNMTAGPEGPMNQTPGYTPIKGVDYFDGLNNMTAGPEGPMNQTANQTVGVKGDKGDKGDTGEIPDSSQFYYLNGSRILTGNLNVGNNRIINVSASTTNGDALPYRAWAAWVPTLTWATATPASITCTAKWTQIGKTAFYNIYINSADSNAATGLEISNLPFTPDTGVLTQTASGAEYYNTAGVFVTSTPYVHSQLQKIFLRNFVTPIDGQQIEIYISGFAEV
jgi:hypothetical protein